MNVRPMDLDTSDDDIRFDRLVDGELSAEEYRTLLAALDDEPGGWRRCALAFLEAQSLGRELGVELVPAIEMSCVHPYAEDLHVCGYWVDLEKIGPACARARGLSAGSRIFPTRCAPARSEPRGRACLAPFSHETARQFMAPVLL